MYLHIISKMCLVSDDKLCHVVSTERSCSQVAWILPGAWFLIFPTFSSTKFYVLAVHCILHTVYSTYFDFQCWPGHRWLKRQHLSAHFNRPKKNVQFYRFEIVASVVDPESMGSLDPDSDPGSLMASSGGLGRINKRGFFGFIFLCTGTVLYDIQHCFICRPLDSTVSEDAGIEPSTVATTALAVRRSNHSARSHLHSVRSRRSEDWNRNFKTCFKRKKCLERKARSKSGFNTELCKYRYRDNLYFWSFDYV